MAREMILVPKVKCEEMMGKNSDDTSIIPNTEKPENPENIVLQNVTPQIFENASPQTTSNENDVTPPKNSTTDAENTIPLESLRRSMRTRKRKQRGGTLYVKASPSRFMKQNKRQWLSFKV